VIIDISESKRAEMERQIIEGHLLQAQKMESVGRLAGGVAHEFNNMLQVINAHADLAQKSIAASDPLNSHLQAIAKAGSRSADIVRQLLAFARKQIITPQTLELNAVIANTLEILRGLIGENIDTLWKPAPHACLVKMDRAQIDEILVNLVLNARDAISGIGRIAIATDTVELGEVDSQSHPDIPPGSYVLLEISDNGSGIDTETQLKLFEPFFTTKPQGAGTGLGLSTVYGIVKQNNGIIEVSSKLGEGTTFRIFLPREKAGARLPASAFAKRELPGGNETVLLVEDEEALLRIGRLLLEDLGYKVLAASGPNQGIRIAAEYAGDIHLLLTDVIMPEMSGRELRDRLLALRPGMKCLFMSGYTADIIAHRGVLDSGVHFFQKPFSRDSLAMMLREALDGQ
jgi:nitrogen-specific signal transduction histidine kinase/CheY-like chemotaxis protein